MMKSVLSLFLFLSSLIVFSQPYKPMLDNYNEWHFTTCHFGCLTDIYYTNGDTLVDGKNYKVLDGFHYISRNFLLRENVSEKKVYLNIVDIPGAVERLLYDFSLEVDDTFEIFNPISPFPEEGGFYQVDSIILRPLVDGNDYRHFYLSPTPTNTVSTTKAVWVEGVGSLSLVNAPGGKPDINDVGHLSCFFKSSESFYANLDSISSCEPTIVLGINQAKLKEVVLYRPLDEDMVILGNATEVQNVNIFDIGGRKVHSTDNNGKNRISIDTSKFKAGVYLIVASDDNYNKRTFRMIIN